MVAIKRKGVRAASSTMITIANLDLIATNAVNIGAHFVQRISWIHAVSAKTCIVVIVRSSKHIKGEKNASSANRGGRNIDRQQIFVRFVAAADLLHISARSAKREFVMNVVHVPFAMNVEKGDARTAAKWNGVKTVPYNSVRSAGGMNVLDVDDLCI